MDYTEQDIATCETETLSLRIRQSCCPAIILKDGGKESSTNKALLNSNKACYLSSGVSSDRRENPEQIPSSHNEGQTKAKVSEQARIEGERKEVDVKDFPKAAAIAKF
jgi:hypothetical protein